MINKIKLILISSVFLVSCEDYLSESPDNRLEIDTLEKIAALGASAYAQGTYLFTEELTDLAGPMGDTNSQGQTLDAGGNTINITNEQAYSFEDITDDDGDGSINYWNDAYKAIAHANQVLESLPGIDGETSFKEALKGEALLSRAYYHFMIVNLFGKHYDEATASTDLGIPYIEAPETTLLPNYTRQSVKQVYDLVERDLIEGLELINEDFFNETEKKFHFSEKAGLAFATRFYLWKGDFDKVIEMTDLFYDDKTPIDFIKDFSLVGGANYNEIVDSYNALEDDSNLLFAQVFTTHQRRSRGYRLNSNGLNALLASPIGTHAYGNVGGIWQVGTQSRYLARIREFFFRENLSSTTGLPYIIEQLFKGEEVILNRAEAKLRSSNFDGALADLNILVAAHYNGSTYDEATIDNLALQNGVTRDEQLLDVIIEERKVEFLDHGLRWFDIKRFNIPVTHEIPLAEGGGTVTLESDDLRKVFQIPPDAISTGLTPNPR